MAFSSWILPSSPSVLSPSTKLSGEPWCSRTWVSFPLACISKERPAIALGLPRLIFSPRTYGIITLVRANTDSKSPPIIGTETELGGGEGGGGGKGFGNGGEGGNGNDNNQGEGEGGGESNSKKNRGISTSQKITLAYAILIGVGGVIGYVKGGSQKSLAAGVLSSLLLFYVYTKLPATPVFASSLGLGISATLLVVMGSRFKKSKKVFPAGVVSLASLIMTGGYIHGIMRTLHV